MYDLDQQSDLKGKADLNSFGEMNLRKALIFLSLIVSMGAIVYGCIMLKWNMPETSAMFLALAMVVGAIAGAGASLNAADFKGIIDTFNA